MKKQTAFFLLIIIPFLYLRAQSGDFVFDPKKLLPTTTAQIDSTASRVYNAGMTSRSTIGLFKESIPFIGQITRGKDSLITSYCQGIDTIITKVNTSSLEKILRQNLSFLKDHALCTKEGNIITYTCDTVLLSPSQKTIYHLKNASLHIRNGADSLTFTHLDGLYSPVDASLEIQKATLCYPINDTDSITYHIASCTMGTDYGSFVCQSALASFPLYKLEKTSGVFSLSQANKTDIKFSSHRTDILIKDTSNYWTARGRFTMKNKELWVEKDQTHHARLFILRNDSLSAKILSEEILITDTTVRVPSSSVVLYVKNDSITHPMLLSVYRRDTRTLTLYQSSDPLSSAPYFDSFSALKLFARAVQLDVPTANIAFAFDPRTRPLVISDRYFEKEIYKYFQGTSLKNPLPTILSICGTYSPTPVDVLAQRMGIPTAT
ncbi:MAG: hypothetical protein PHD21_01205, partial [Flavobacteriales bacterium]|nr:hypothetical protein [Flavobacteriales bacterium]